MGAGRLEMYKVKNIPIGTYVEYKGFSAVFTLDHAFYIGRTMDFFHMFIDDLSWLCPEVDSSLAFHKSWLE